MKNLNRLIITTILAFSIGIDAEIITIDEIDQMVNEKNISEKIYKFSSILTKMAETINGAYGLLGEKIAPSSETQEPSEALVSDIVETNNNIHRLVLAYNEDFIRVSKNLIKSIKEIENNGDYLSKCRKQHCEVCLYLIRKQSNTDLVLSGLIHKSLKHVAYLRSICEHPEQLKHNEIAEKFLHLSLS